MNGNGTLSPPGKTQTNKTPQKTQKTHNKTLLPASEPANQYLGETPT